MFVRAQGQPSTSTAGKEKEKSVEKEHGSKRRHEDGSGKEEKESKKMHHSEKYVVTNDFDSPIIFIYQS